MLTNPIDRSGGPTQAATATGHHLRVVEDDVISAWGHDPHVHAHHHQFLYCLVGHAVVQAGQQAFRLSSEVAVWIPANVWHSADFGEDCLVLPVCFDAARHDLGHSDTRLVPVSTRQRRGLLAFERTAEADTEPGADLFALLQDDGRRLPLPMPRSPVTRAVASGLEAVPHDSRTLTEWAESLYTSSTTLRRAFLSETGLTFSEWRTRNRLNASVDLLASGTMVSAAAARVGFTSTNGYILAFRRHFGTTPKAFASAHL